MRIPAMATAIAVSLMAAAPVSAQRASLADRVAVLEQRAATSQANVDLLNQVTQLKSELQALRAQVAATQAQGADERAGYDAAFNALKAGQYAESAQRFQAFLTRFPNGTYAPNALYWLGESYYVTQNYQLAQQQFQALLDRYSTHG